MLSSVLSKNVFYLCMCKWKRQCSGYRVLISSKRLLYNLFVSYEEQWKESARVNPLEYFKSAGIFAEKNKYGLMPKCYVNNLNTILTVQTHTYVRRENANNYLSYSLVVKRVLRISLRILVLVCTFFKIFEYL